MSQTPLTSPSTGSLWRCSPSGAAASTSTPCRSVWVWRTSRPSASSWAAPPPTSPWPPPGSAVGAAIITGVGNDPSAGSYDASWSDLGVADTHVVTNTEYPTPVTFCEIFPPDDFPLYFYRKPNAPDLQIRPSDLDFDAVRDAGCSGSR